MTPLKWIERYHVRLEHEHGGWAVIHIDSKGFLGVVSDYGNFAFHWTDFGGDFKAFLSGVDWDYLHGKLLLGHRKRYVYDSNETRLAITSHIQQERAKGAMTEAEATDELLLLEGELYEEDSFSHWTEETRIDSPWELRRTMHEPQCRMFCQKVWPHFIEAMNAGQYETVVSEKELSPGLATS